MSYSRAHVRGGRVRGLTRPGSQEEVGRQPGDSDKVPVLLAVQFADFMTDSTKDAAAYKKTFTMLWGNQVPPRTLVLVPGPSLPLLCSLALLWLLPWTAVRARRAPAHHLLPRSPQQPQAASSVDPITAALEAHGAPPLRHPWQPAIKPHLGVASPNPRGWAQCRSDGTRLRRARFQQ